MFNIGDMVVYGGTGVCRIEDISTIKMDGVPKEKLYYILSAGEKKDDLIYAPKENGRILMRRVLSRQEAEELIESIPSIELLPEVDDRARENLYREYIKSCDCRNLLRIIKTLYLRGRTRVEEGKKTSMLDDRYLKQAEETLYAELSAALDIPKGEMSAYITERIGGLPARQSQDEL